MPKEEESFWENWRKWYQDKRDYLTQNMGTLIAFKTRSMHVSWDLDILRTNRDVLDALNIIMEGLETTSKNFQNIFNRLDSLEKKTGTFGQLEEYIPILGHLKQFLDEKQLEEEKRQEEEKRPKEEGKPPKKEEKAMYRG